MFLARVIRIRLDDLVQQLDLVDGRLRVVGGRANHLQRDMPAGVRISRQPDCRKMAPAELSHDDVLSIFEDFTHGDGVVATLAVVLRILLFGRDIDVLVGGGGRRW